MYPVVVEVVQLHGIVGNVIHLERILRRSSFDRHLTENGSRPVRRGWSLLFLLQNNIFDSGLSCYTGAAPELRIVKIVCEFPDFPIKRGDHGLEMVRLDD